MGCGKVRNQEGEEKGLLEEGGGHKRGMSQKDQARAMLHSGQALCASPLQALGMQCIRGHDGQMEAAWI